MNLRLLNLITDFAEDPTKIEDIIAIETLLKSFWQACAYIDLAKALGWPEDDIPDEDDIEKDIQEGSMQELFLIRNARDF